MVQYINSIKQEPVEKYLDAFNLLKEKKDYLNKNKGFQIFQKVAIPI